MAIGYIALLPFKAGLCGRSILTYTTIRQQILHPNKCVPPIFRWRHVATSTKRLGFLSNEEVTDILKTNEHSQEITAPGVVKSYDANQLASNNPIEDAKTEAMCKFTSSHLFGIFDGHGGAACSRVISNFLLAYVAASLIPKAILVDYLQTHQQASPYDFVTTYSQPPKIPKNLASLYEETFQSYLNSLAKEKQQKGHSHVMDAIAQAFVQLDQDITALALSGKPLASAVNVALAGSVACVVYADGPNLYIANTGDCQAVIGVLSDTNAWLCKPLTKEHNAENAGEVERILSEHPNNERETVIKQDRLLGHLAPLRAFGDCRFKWKKEDIKRVFFAEAGESVLIQNYYTPPYLTAKPEVTHYRLTQQDKFLIIASDGLWEHMSPAQVIRLVGEHMSGKVTLRPVKLPQRPLKLKEINEMLQQRREGLSKKPLDANAATHLIRLALGSTEFGLDHGRLSQMLTLPPELVRSFRDDITITVVFFETNLLRHYPESQ